MKDQHSAALIATLHPKFGPDAQALIEEWEQQTGRTFRITSTHRSMEDQAKIYAQGRTTPGPIVTDAPPGSSWHEYDLAFDGEALNENGSIDYTCDLSLMANLGGQWSITWGGNWTGGFKDMDHFEQQNGLTWQQAYHKYLTKDFIEGTTFINIP